jgi:hypothetical protein
MEAGPSKQPAQMDNELQQSDGTPLPSPEPHRPPNAFILFSKTVRESVRCAQPGKTNIEYTKVMARMWKETPEEEKAKFKDEAAKLQKEFKTKFPDYTYRESKNRRRKGITTGVVPPPNSIFPATTWEVRWDQMPPPNRAPK